MFPIRYDRFSIYWQSENAAKSSQAGDKERAGRGNAVIPRFFARTG
jgi:hypothetical protein